MKASYCVFDTVCTVIMMCVHIILFCACVFCVCACVRVCVHVCLEVVVLGGRGHRTLFNGHILETHQSEEKEVFGCIHSHQKVVYLCCNFSTIGSKYNKPWYSITWSCTVHYLYTVKPHFGL